MTHTKNNILLTGFMGAGKSGVARELANDCHGRCAASQ